MRQQLLLILLKVLVMVLFFIIVMIFGSLPIRYNQFKQRPLLRAMGSVFAGSLFLNVALLHILPQSADTIQQFLKNGQDKQVFPLAYLLLIVGFLITVYFTKVFISHTHKDDHLASKQSLLSQEHTNQAHLPQSALINSQASNLKHHQTHSHHHHQDTPKSIIGQAYLLTLAIYFHTIFQGIAIGVQNSITGFLSTAVAITFHKWADALSMGCHYRNKNIPKKTAYILILGQALLNVAAIGVGWLIASKGDFVEAIFLSLSAGTFLAISTMQLLSQQFHHRKYIHRKFFLLILATGFVSGIWFVQNMIFIQE